ncbi:hypothetical protein C5167_046708 [Papaver somniferum]|uniref:Uncharacterized protein n=1 Tax=Papaver somniferum TaxID=3469 RepID=A0A4Y7LI31_PAPSO|nr:hypothetical protein C5167_046708 [Papaver somniferum]
MARREIMVVVARLLSPRVEGEPWRLDLVRDWKN